MSQGCASSLDRFSDPGDFMRLKVIHEDDSGRLHTRSDHIFDVGGPSPSWVKCDAMLMQRATVAVGPSSS